MSARFDYRRPELFTGTGGWLLGFLGLCLPSVVAWESFEPVTGHLTLSTGTRKSALVTDRTMRATWTANT